MYGTVQYGTVRYRTKNVQFFGCGTESQGGTYWVRRYAVRELRFSVLTVPVKREVVILTTTGPFTVCGSFSFAQTELCLARCEQFFEFLYQRFLRTQRIIIY